MSAAAVAVTETDGACWLSLARPPLNVLDVAAIHELTAALEPLATRRDLKAVVLRSDVAGVFSAGVDVRDHARARVDAMLTAFHALIRLLDGLPQVAIAAVDGHCLGGGCELATCCDFVLATPRARFAQPEIDVGCFPPVAAVLLPRLVGRRAAEMILLGATLDAEAAHAAGLVTQVAGDVDAAARALVARLAAKSAPVLAAARQALRAERGLAAGLARSERIYREALLPTEDVDEGVRAFVEKRPPRWRDR